MMARLHDDFLLNPDVIFLNHGSFGACPRPIFEEYQRWQLELERQPVAFLGRRYDALMDEARAALCIYVNAGMDDLIFVPNATFGVNLVARSLAQTLDLGPGDEILATDHEYGAVDYTWQAVCQQTGAHYIRQPIPVPLDEPDDVVELLWQGVTERTKIIAISHITSPTALILPVAAICRRAREHGIITVIDGAHAPGQIPLDLGALNADFYTGNCHKWLCAPKGAGFLYANPKRQALLQPLIVSWGWPETGFVRRNQWQGTGDIAAYLSVPAAIDYQQHHQWDNVRLMCHQMAVEARNRINTLTGQRPLISESGFVQMFSVVMPVTDILALKTQLYDLYQVEVPGIDWGSYALLRISIQRYNTQADVDALIDGLAHLITQ